MKKSIMLGLLILVINVVTSCSACRSYQREQDMFDAEYKGKGELLQAESNKKVLVETAKANLESAKMNAEADVIRAKGVAEANKIIGQSLENNRAYLEWLWIDNIEKNQNAVFYIPTENKMPLMLGK